MKELSIEDKAKAYDELIKRLNKAREDVGCYTFKSVYDEVMSELAESEDEKFLRYLIDCCKDTIESDDKGLELSMVTTKRLFAWLEKQGEKGINGKNMEIPFSEQKPAISDNALREGIAHFGITQYQIDNWLKKYVDVEKQGSQNLANSVKTCKDAWSEEDEKILNLIIARLHSHPNVEVEEYGKDYHLLKSIKDRYTWKPSHEQMLALEAKLTMPPQSPAMTSALIELYQQLKKLREE